MVGDDPEEGARPSPVGGRREKPLAEEPPLPLFLLRPGIEEVRVESGDGIRRQVLDRFRGVGADDPRVREAGSRDPVARDPVVGEASLDAEEPPIRAKPRGLDQESRLARAELDLEGRSSDRRGKQ
jgi:hypothetical protein